MSPGPAAGCIASGCEAGDSVGAAAGSCFGLGPGEGAQRGADRRPGRLRLGPTALHEVAELAPGAAAGAGQFVGQSFEEPVDLPPVPFGDAAHHEDGGGGQVGVSGGQGGQLERRHLGVLHGAELVLQHRELAHEAGGPAAVDVAAELEGVAQPLAPDAQGVEVR